MARQFLAATTITAVTAAAVAYSTNRQQQIAQAPVVIKPAIQSKATIKPVSQMPYTPRTPAGERGVEVMDKNGNGAIIRFHGDSIDGEIFSISGQKNDYKIVIIDFVSPMTIDTKSLTAYAFIQEPDGKFALWYKEEAIEFLK